ncbi:MAG: hypothetical protein IJR49_01570, partial [Treponema sp.]|nr:hypothetical protein [Treponema sp.]
MKDRIQNGANLLESHVFQFDFLNDEFLPRTNGGKLPDDLYKIITNKEERKKLVIYINPPYAETTTASTVTGTGANKSGVATTNRTYEKYKNIIGKASNEIYAQFLIRIYCELQFCKIANFAKLKALCAFNFADFRNVYKAKLEKLFIVPANIFDNVKGQFPIGFHFWNGNKQEKFSKIIADVFNADGKFFGHKKISIDSKNYMSINRWMKKLDIETENIIG